MLVTNKSLVFPCLSFQNREVKIFQNGKTYEGNVWGWSELNADDYATISSALEPPRINLYNETIPQAGWWVMVASYLPGIGITWTTSRIISVNLKEYFFLLESSPPSLGTGGPVFDNLGNFLGIVTFVQNSNVDLAKVSGSPNVCNAPGSLSGTGIANCAIGSKDKVWIKKAVDIIPTPSPTPKPSPSKSSVDTLLEIRNAHNAALAGYKLFTYSVNSCLEAFQGKSFVERRVLEMPSGRQICSSENSTAKFANDRNISLEKTISSSKSPSELASLLEEFNTLINTFNLSSGAIEDAILMAERLSSVADEFDEIQQLLNSYNNSLSKVDLILSEVPVKVQALITKGFAFDYLAENREVLSVIQSQFDSAASNIQGIAIPDLEAAENFEKALAVISRTLPRESTFERTFERAYEAIPSFYCKKGKNVTLPKKGKCSSGFVRVTIKK